MTQSEKYYDPINHGQEFNDSVVIRPISVKPSVVPSLLNKSNPQNNILAAYDSIKLTQYINYTQEGRVIELISLQQNSLGTQLTEEGIQFLSRYSGSDIAFFTVVGEKGSGKSFLIDKWLNLSNVQGNNFSTAPSKPSIRIWSTPFLKQDLKCFPAEVAGCSPGSKQFDKLLPYMTLISSVLICLEDFHYNKNATQSSAQKLNKKLGDFMDSFYSQTNSKVENRKELLDSIFPGIIYRLYRKQTRTSAGQNAQLIRTQGMYLPDGKNAEYRGFDQDLKVHSFLNKKCISQKYIQRLSQLFYKVYSSIEGKKHRQLGFNGGIMMKYIGQMQLFANKTKKIDMGEVYYQIVKDLYISAYNYCVICYHQALEEALSDERPRQIDQLIHTFELSSNHILQKYNQFSLERSLHEEYEAKLISHIESKERLIMEINKKKTDLELTSIYDQKVQTSNLKQIVTLIKNIHSQNQNYTHGRDQTLGRKLAQINQKTKKNNVDYLLAIQTTKLNEAIEMRKQELHSLRQTNRLARVQSDKIKSEQNSRRNKLQNQNNQLDRRIEQMRKSIKQQQRVDYNPGSTKAEEERLSEVSQRNLREIQKLQQQAESSIQRHKKISDMRKQLELTRSNIKLREEMLKQLPSAQQNTEQEQINMKLKKETSTTEQKKALQNKEIKDPSKVSKKGK